MGFIINQITNKFGENIVIEIGGDPRHLPTFDTIRQEINKINHPSQPEISWKKIESLALDVFRQNGIDLQTAVYYTLSRVKIADLAGLTEGCELLAGVISTEWETCWPTNDTARAEILTWLIARVGYILPHLTDSDKDLPLLYRTGKALQLINDKLQSLNLKKTPRIENLLTPIQMHIQQASTEIPAIKKILEHHPEPFQETYTRTHSKGDASSSSDRSATTVPIQRVYVAFIAGILCSFLFAVLYSCLYIIPLKKQIAELTDHPQGVSLLWLSQPDLESYDQQLNRLTSASPLTLLEISKRSVELARQHWPENDRQKRESQRWQQLIHTSSEQTNADNGYYKVQQYLQQLNDKLLEQEKNRGGITISYLKTAVYQMQEALSGDVPLEELLRQLETFSQQGKAAPMTLLKKIDDHWNRLLMRYYYLSQKIAHASKGTYPDRL